VKILPQMYMYGWTKEEMIKFGKSSACIWSGCRKFWRILQHCDIWHFPTISGSYFL